MAINLYYINGKWITLTGLLHYSCELIGLSPLTRQSANRPCKTKQNKEPNNDHQDFHNNFKGKKGPNLAALAAVEWNWKESPWGAGSVQIESTCWSLESELKGFVLFWLSCFIDTSYINLSKTLKKSKSCVWQGRLVSWAERFLTLVTTQWQQMLFFNHYVLGRYRFYSVHAWYFTDWQIRKYNGRTRKQEDGISFVFLFFFSKIIKKKKKW